ncbi:hypothetical protein BDV26DRAFT_299897 [Aspergillus bertholletiae]|uniref:Uncharacterized protein n=1 Tax=Aspergillus bertholletiae TaxID=1226010 RepID=A0A5N7AYQ4_9EURO|nr:hypothetical protein BDV26DRAFT_299897 [Aspergillus bertholletiae]
MMDRDKMDDNSDPFRQLRYLPPPQTSQYHQSSQHLFHPRPIRPAVDPACLRQRTDPSGAIDSFSLHEGLFGQRELSPGTGDSAIIESQGPQRNRLYLSPEYVNWRFGGPIPSDWRVTVTPRVVNSPRPEQHRILVPDIETPESYERCRDISTSFLCSQPDRTVLEHAAILHSMKNFEPEPVTVTTESPKIVSRPGSACEGTLTGSGDPSEQSCPLKEATVLEPTNEPGDMFPFPMPTVGREVILCEFEELVVHTAKCDICNKRNSCGMSRCLTCGWQTCNQCTIDRGYFRTHHINGNIHTGPTSQNDLDAAAEEISKAKRKRSPPKRKKSFRNARKSRKGHLAQKKTPKKAPRTPLKSSIVSNRADTSQEAFAEEDCDSENRKKHYDQDVWDIDPTIDDDDTEYLPEDDQLEEGDTSTWSPFNGLLRQGSMHSRTPQKTQPEHDIQRQKKFSGKNVESTKESDAEKTATKSKPSEEQTKAQIYCRKQPGRYSRL